MSALDGSPPAAGGLEPHILFGLCGLSLALLVLNVFLVTRLCRRGSSSVDIDWCQSLEAVEVRPPCLRSRRWPHSQSARACPSQVSVPLPKGRVSHDVKCEIMPTRFSLAIRGEKPEPYLSGTLFRPINVDESHWQLWPVGARTRLAARAAVRAPEPTLSLAQALRRASRAASRCRWPRRSPAAGRRCSRPAPRALWRHRRRRRTDRMRSLLFSLL